MFTRYGAPTGVLLIAPAALPAVGIEMLYASGAVGPLINEVVGFDPTSLGLALAISATLVVLVRRRFLAIRSRCPDQQPTRGVVALT